MSSASLPYRCKKKNSRPVASSVPHAAKSREDGHSIVTALVRSLSAFNASFPGFINSFKLSAFSFNNGENTILATAAFRKPEMRSSFAFQHPFPAMSVVELLSLF